MWWRRSYPVAIDEGEEVQESAADGTIVVKGGEGEAAVEAISATNITSIFWAMDSTLRARGTNVHRFTFPSTVVVNDLSQVMVSICELNGSKPTIGAAAMSILNVAPHGGSPSGSVEVAYKVDWNDLLPIRFNFIIAN